MGVWEVASVWKMTFPKVQSGRRPIKNHLIAVADSDLRYFQDYQIWCVDSYQLTGSIFDDK